MAGARSSQGSIFSAAGGGRRRLAFVGLLAVLVLGIALTPVVLIRPLLDGTARATAALLPALGVPVITEGNALQLDNGVLLITRDCTGIYLVAVFASLVLTYAAPARSRLLALAWGIPALVALNYVRLLGAGLVLQSFPDAFGVVHDFAFQVVLMLSVVFLWLVWLSRLNVDDRVTGDRAV